MKNQMLKILLILVVSVLLCSSAFAEGGIDINYDVTSRTLSFDGNSDTGFVNIAVMPRDCVDNADTCITSHSHSILLTVSADGGTLDSDIVIGDSFPAGCYLAQADCGEESYKRYFAVTTSGTGATLSEMGLNTTYGTEIEAQRASYNVADSSDFADMSVLSEGIILMKKGSVKAEDFISYYTTATGSYDLAYEYNQLADDLKTEVKRLLPRQIFTQSLDNVWEDALVLAKVNVNGVASEEELIDYLTSKGEDLTSYNLLTNYYKELMMSSLTAEAVYDDIATLVSNFRSGVSYQLTQMNNPSDDTYTDTGTGSGGGGGGGGGYSISDKPKEPQEEKNEIKFNDIASHWAKNEIIKMTDSGVINGYADGSFKPDKSITRAEFVKLLTGMLALPNGSGNTFSDVTADKWFAPFVYAASEYGIINGVTENTFAPDTTITREDAALILYRALSKKGVSFNESLGFSDNTQISDYAKTAVGSLTAGEIIKGDNGLFRPKDSLSRAETVTMLSRISGYIK